MSIIQKKTREELYDLFRQGAIPSGADFADLLRSSINILDDGLDVPDDPLLPIQLRGHSELWHLLDFCNEVWEPQWRLSQKSADSSEGLTLTAASRSRLFLERETGNLGLGTEKPSARCHLSQVGDGDALRIDDEATDMSPLVVDSTGKLGVGIERPEARVHISHTGSEDSVRIDDKKDDGGIEDDTPFVIKNDGKVGIGFAEPGAKVAINGGVHIGAQADPGAGNLAVANDIRVGHDTYLGSSDQDKTIVPAQIQSLETPTASSAVVINDSLNVTQNLSVSGDLSFGVDSNDSVTIKGNAYIESDLTVRQDALVEGSLTVDENTLIKGDLTVNQDALVGNSLTVDENTLVKGDLTVNQNALVGNSLTVDEDTLIKGDLTVSSAVVVNDSLDVTQNLNVNGNLKTDQNVEIVGNLTVTGEVVVKAKVLAQGSVIQLGDDNNDQVSIPGKLNAGDAGALQINDSVNISGSLTASGLSGNGAGLTGLNGDQVSSGTVNISRLPHSTDTRLGDSNVLLPTQKAVKAYCDSVVASDVAPLNAKISALEGKIKDLEDKLAATERKIPTGIRWGTVEETGWENSYDGYFSTNVSQPNVLVGLKSQHNNHHEDRLFAYKYRSLEFKY